MEIKYVCSQGWNCINTTQHITESIKTFQVYPAMPGAREEFAQLERDCVPIYRAAEANSHKACLTKSMIQKWNKFLKLFFTTFETPLTLAGCIGPIEQFSDGITRNPPSFCGVYLIGATHFNPITREEFYWVKNGKANNIAKRMAQYDTHSPMIYQIDFKECPDERTAYKVESVYQSLLKEVAINSCANNAEWFRVTRETYLAICAKGFSYFC